VGSAEYGLVIPGIINVAKTAVKELALYNITVNALGPGMVRTPTNFKVKDKGSNALSVNRKSILM